jgi:hypothetical protein
VSQHQIQHTQKKPEGFQNKVTENKVYDVQTLMLI